jgi:hypothetical protein
MGRSLLDIIDTDVAEDRNSLRISADVGWNPGHPRPRNEPLAMQASIEIFRSGIFGRLCVRPLSSGQWDVVESAFHTKYAQGIIDADAANDRNSPRIPADVGWNPGLPRPRNDQLALRGLKGAQQ